MQNEIAAENAFQILHSDCDDMSVFTILYYSCLWADDLTDLGKTTVQTSEVLYVEVRDLIVIRVPGRMQVPRLEVIRYSC